MVTEQEIHELPVSEKIRVMELIWSDLESSTENLESPEWHKRELKKTRERFTSGVEEPIDLADAKEALINQRR